jgi:hypothetical protein
MYTSKWFSEDAIKEMFSYDCLLDFDSEKDNINEMKKEYMRICNLLKSFDLKFNTYPSSSSGYHIVLDFDNFYFVPKFSSDFSDTDSFNYKISMFVDILKKRFCLKYLDTNGIGVYNKIRKCEYSLVNLHHVYPIGITYNILELGYRGLLYSNSDEPIILQKRFKELLKTYDLKI